MCAAVWEQTNPTIKGGRMSFAAGAETACGEIFSCQLQARGKSRV